MNAPNATGQKPEWRSDSGEHTPESFPGMRTTKNMDTGNYRRTPRGRGKAIRKTGPNTGTGKTPRLWATGVAANSKAVELFFFMAKSTEREGRCRPDCEAIEKSECECQNNIAGVLRYKQKGF